MVGLLAVATFVAGVMAWRAADSRLPEPGLASVEGSVTLLPAISLSDATEAQPVGVAVSGDRLYVADVRRGLVDVLTRDGSRVATIGAGFLKAPAYVAVGPVDGLVYVTDRGRDVVVVYSTTGERIRFLGPGGADPTSTVASSWKPLALGFAPDGTLYVTDASVRQQVVVFSPTGRRIGSLGAGIPAGRTGQELSFANGVAATDDAVLVADSNNGRIVVLDRQGGFVRELLTTGLPRGIAALPDGGFVMTDAALGVVRSYSAVGLQTGEAGLSGDTAGIFATPSGVAVSEDGRIFVGDTGNGRVDVLRMSAVGRRVVPVDGRTARPWAIAAAVLLAATVGAVALAVRLARRSVQIEAM
ncbi:MAG TPA: hypothetical protein VIK31_11030 [Propionibacteriaceae bacterium]